MDPQVIYGIASLLAVAAGWDAARRYFAAKGSAFEGKLKAIELAQKGIGERHQKLEKDVLEAIRSANSAEKPRLSRFQR